MIDHEVYRTLLAELGFTQVEAARFLNVNERTSRRWASGDQPVPTAVLMLLAVMTTQRYDLSPDDVRELIGLEPHDA